MEIPEDVYSFHAPSHVSDGISTGLDLDYDIFCNDASQQGFLGSENAGANTVYAMDQPEQVHVNTGYVSHEGRDVMFCPEQKYDAVGQYTVEPINIPLSKRQEPLTLTPPRSVGSDSPMDDQGIAVHMGPDTTIDVAKYASIFGNHSLLSNGLEDPMNDSPIYVIHSSREPEPRRKRRKTEPDAMISDSPSGMTAIKSEPCSLSDDVFIDTDSSTSSLCNEMPSPDGDVTSYQCLKWSQFKKNHWQSLYDENQEVVSMVDFHVDADKGFNFSFADDSFVCQKKNHFQITVNIKAESTPKYIKVKDNFKPIDKFKIHLFGVKVESINSTIKIEQSQADRSKRPYEPVTIPFPDQEPSRMTIGRLHFSETTSNNMRKKGKPNPDQRYFMLAVALHAHSKNDHQLIYASVSDRIIVRASNPGQFENDVEVVWSRGHTADSVFRVGRVGINTDRPCESLSVHGNVRVTGRIMMPSDKRIKENLTEVDSSEQLRNVSKMKLYRYSYSQEYLDIAGVNTDLDTGVIAQEVREVLPDAVKESEDLKLPDGKKIEKFLVVNKERIFMENVGAVKELCKLTDKLEIRIDELEKVSKKLQSRRRADTSSSCFSSLSRASSFSQTSSTRSTVDEPSSPEKKTSRHGHRYRCARHNCQQRCHQQVVLEESNLCTPRFLQFVIVTLILVMSLSVGAMAALYIMQDSNQRGFSGDSSEAFGADKANVTTKPTGTTVPTPVNSTVSTSPLSEITKSGSVSTKLRVVTTESSIDGPTPTGNTTKNSTSSREKPNHGPIFPTEGKGSSSKYITSKPQCKCCGQSDICDSVHYSQLANKPVYFEISNALPANKPAKSVHLRIVERNYHLNCDICGSTNESFYIPISSTVPFQPITLEINSTSDTLVLMCSNHYYLQCPEKTTQPPYDTILKKDSWKKYHHWRLPPAFYFSSSFRFRVVKRSSSSSISTVNCSTNFSTTSTTFKDYYIRFIRVCKT